MTSQSSVESERLRLLPLVLLGLGLGGFFDGIVLHQVLQWHHMLSAHPGRLTASTSKAR